MVDKMRVEVYKCDKCGKIFFATGPDNMDVTGKVIWKDVRVFVIDGLSRHFCSRQCAKDYVGE